MKVLVVNTNGDILVVKESGLDWWNMPDGGMEHGETIKDAIARELHEEISLNCDFKYEVISVEDPHLLRRVKAWQMRIIFIVRPQDETFAPGDDGDEIVFMKPEYFQESDATNEQEIYQYWQIAKSRHII
ncbi:MAG: NUDIX hydrolase [Candidatus Saccharibacteria bacterium GW2011_GWC2_48_9]|nr:MAG: NUDIX hydrolase [Candidatus Saccharibacteria bacterium GW2011_GWC2_48_9]HCH34921.1 hypothetical protein [Candidatus Saccharibacteria bacterium]